MIVYDNFFMFTCKIIISLKAKIINLNVLCTLNITASYNNDLLPAQPVTSATEGVKGLFLGNVVFLC